MKIRVTGYKSFGVKSLKIVAKEKDFILVNFFGFAIWLFK